ncbi:MAG TPA: hypothetical protein PLU53_12055 [Bacteroidia bacterium]|nr:hypothetical protein [Bacteroidia bacterium]
MNGNQNKTNALLIAILLIVIAAITRMIPHPFNFTAIGAIALFSGATFRDKRFAYLLPFTAMILTDLYLGFHFSILPVYGCFALTVALGTTLKNQPKLLPVAGLSILSSIIFFLVTNLPIWYADMSLYPLSWTGTMESYTMALPFFGNQIVGDLFYTGAFFGIYHVVEKSRKIAFS